MLKPIRHYLPRIAGGESFSITDIVELLRNERFVDDLMGVLRIPLFLRWLIKPHVENVIRAIANYLDPNHSLGQ